MELTLKVQKREKNERLENDFMPAVLYGKEIENRSLKLKKLDFEKVFAAAENLI